MTVATDSIAHLIALAEILRALESDGIGLCEHRYEPEAFGNFMVVLGRAHKRVKFEWNGRQSLLIVSFSEVANQSSTPTWVHDMDVKLPNAEGLYAEIASNAEDMLAT